MEDEILKVTKEFAEANGVHYDEMTESMILNAIREVARIKDNEIHNKELIIDTIINSLPKIGNT